jgi:hypothetical protein
MKPVNTEGSIDLILTPQFYTLRREMLPVKYAYQAKKIAPSLFDGLIEGSEKYEYFVYREGDAWVFIAYDPEEIITFLREKGIPLEKVKRVCFAQQVASQLSMPIKLGEQSVLTVINDTVTVAPLSAVKESVAFDPKRLQVPKKGVHLDAGSSSVISKKQMLILSAIVLMFGLLWLIEGVRYNKDNSLLQNKIAKFYAENPSLQSSYTRESVAGKYRKIDTVERKKRYIVGKIAGLLFKGVTLEMFDMNSKGYKAMFSTTDGNVAKRLKALLKSAGFTESPLSSGDKIVIEGRL